MLCIKIASFEANENILYQYIETLRVSFNPYVYVRHGKKMPVKIILCENEDSDVMCIKFIFHILYCLYYLSWFKFVAQKVTIRNVPNSANRNSDTGII